jgi:molybdenum cofactor cytidylyltransferase
MSVGVLLLAAGASRRFGTDKRYARLASGETVLESTIRCIQSVDLPLLVAVSSDDDRTLAMLRELRIDCCPCANARRGMGATLAESVAQLTSWSGVLVALADMPFVRAETYRLMAAETASDRIAVPRFEGQRGHPVGFGRLFYPALAGLQGDEGARKLLQKYAAQLDFVDVSDAGILRDIDQPEDLV